ncbi:PH domain-containing protein [Saccharopolyspora hirsuta]|uniref:PH domain-containing protein n=1 Tax=Saccharopolyspora hirsuta TaxID=1837 RepID=A0A5M7C6A5_SACHI|nr:PH domain-containing protein [Saccharopolyspora hirsuta]KAA5837303.1 PH domain-containing protein [Saccharopolyspora hirsuta]
MSTVIDGQWRRQDPRTIASVGLLVLAPMVPTVGIMTLSGAGIGAILLTAALWFAGALALAGLVAVDWWFAWYRITPERFELRKGAVTRNHLSIPRERIRSVDLTAGPSHRVFGITTVKVGTGGQGGDSSELKLDAILRAHAESLRHELLFGDSSTVAGEEAAAEPAESTTLARLNPAWLAYSALSVTLILIVWGAIGSAVGSFRELLLSMGIFSAIGETVQTTALWLVIAIAAGLALVVGVVGAFALSLEMWWGFRLSRDRGDTLQVKRGLLTTRSVSLEERRLRGVELVEPLLLRWSGGARLAAVATGLKQKKEENQPDNKTLMPPAPRAAVQRTSAAVLREPRPPSEVPLRRHPRAALRRRINWALMAATPILIAAVVTAVLGWIPVWLAVTAVVVAVLTFLGFAVDAYRNLGHQLTDRYLIARSGSGIRRTVVLQRDGVIGWKMSRTLFQRRSGLMTVGATTAAGNSIYEVHDVGEEEGLELAREALPGLLAPFLEQR